MLQSIMGYGYPPMDRQMEGQTRVKTLPSRRTTYASGKNHLISMKKSPHQIDTNFSHKSCPKKVVLNVGQWRDHIVCFLCQNHVQWIEF